MAKRGGLTREVILRSLERTLQPLPFVHAFWEAGSAAFNRVDAWSDLDLYIVVDGPGQVPETFLAVERTLATLSPIDVVHEVKWPADSGISQRFYRLREAGEFLLVDLALMTVAAPDKFLVQEVHGNAVVVFDKDGTVKAPPLEAETMIHAILERRGRLRERMALFGPFVLKEIYRNNGLEALEFYRALVLPSLVEALRMRYGPRHYDFRMRYVYRELPPEVVQRLETLAFVKDTKDLRAKYREARSWFDRAIEEIDEAQVRRAVLGPRKG